MLTYPSDSLPQIVCPMDEDAIPPNPFCSAPPLLPFSSITPSCADDGTSGHRRSGRIQGIRAQTPKKQSSTHSEAPPRPSRQNPSPTKRQRESGNMVSQSKQLRVENTHEEQNEDGFDFDFSAEGQNQHKDQKTPCKKPNVDAAENVVEQEADGADADMDVCGGLAVGNTSAPKGWVIGPLFKSFRSKMASFTEIVMSPVKLFRANSPPPPSADDPDGLAECEAEAEAEAEGASDAEPSNMFEPVGRSESWNQEAETHQQRICDGEGAQNSKTGALKKLAFDSELSTHSSEQTDECGITQTEKHSPVPVPLPETALRCVASAQVSEPCGSVFISPVLSEPSVNLSASQESTLEVEELVAGLKPQPRKWTRNRSQVKRVASKTLLSEVKKDESNPEVSDRQLSQTLPLICYSDSLHPDDDDDDKGKKIESSGLVRQSLRNNSNISANAQTLTPDTQQLEQLNSDTYPAVGSGRSKRGVKPSCHTQEPVKRKKLTAHTCTEDTKHQESLNTASKSVKGRGLKPPKKEVVSTNVVDADETLKPPRKRQTASTKANRKGKGGGEMLPTTKEEALNPLTESSPDALLICSLDQTVSVPVENNLKGGGSSRTKRSGSGKKLRTKSGLGESDLNIDSMDLETTVAITSTKPAQQEALAEVLARPELKQLQSTVKSRNINKKPVKRKSPGSKTDSDSSLVSAAPVQPLALMDLNTPPPVEEEEEASRPELNQLPKRHRKGHRGAVKFSDSGATQETKQCINNLHLITKDSQTPEGKGHVSTDPVYFEMTPFENNHQPAPSPPQPDVQVDKQVKQEVETTTPVTGGSSPTDAEAGLSSISVSKLRSSARRVNVKPRRADPQRRRCRVLHGATRKGEEKKKNSITMEDADLTTASFRSSENGAARRLLRSYSCPEIPSLCSQDTSWAPPHHSRTHTSHQHKASHTAHFVPPTHKSLRRARRHTVCSVEVEREIAPLCLRKEVYPASRRSALYDGVAPHLSPGLALSPSTSLSVLASCFLSSPLAFLSKKVEGRGAGASPSTSTHVPSPTSSSSSVTSPLSSSTWHLPGFLQRGNSSHAASDSCGSGNPLACEIERRQQSEEEDEDTSSSSQEYEDAALREEKALSDSEIKVVQKHEERGKVSSIRIRKTLPKPQNNLTPMGLPKPIRLKKKDFSLEEIYTNKNFSKPPESRLETIFEVPLNRRDGSELWRGPKRIKRFLEFLEVGEARKPKKPLVGVGGKAAVTTSRTRRGGFAKDEPSLSAQDVDSLLCAKLDQLNLWLIHDQTDS